MNGVGGQDGDGHGGNPEDGGPDGGGESLAGEYVLGLLTGEELLTARGRIANDTGFAHDVAAWEARLAPLFDAVPPRAPHARVWAAITAALAADHASIAADGTNGAQIVRLKRQVRHWRIGTGIAATVAGVLAVVGLQPGRTPAPPAREVAAPPIAVVAVPPLAAALAPKGGGTIGVVYHPREGRLVALAGALAPRRGRDFQLWVLPPGEAPQPLGVITPGRDRRLTLSAAIDAKLVAGSTIAVSLEPIGGSPTGLPTGPVLATATISPA